MSAAIKWGLICGAVYVISSLTSSLLGFETATKVGWMINIVVFIVTLFLTYLGIKEIRDNEQNGYLTFGEGFRSGMKIALIAGVIACVFSLLNMYLINPGFMEEMRAMMDDQMSEMPEEQAAMSKKIMGIFSNPIIASVFMIVYVAFWGLFKSLIASSILKKEAPPTFTPPVV
jgi:ethanolamine transporter EutH